MDFSFAGRSEWSDGSPHMVAWQGYYEQDGVQVPVSFEDFRVDLEGQISGSGQDGVGLFTICGSLEESGRASFVKQYVEQHSVQYEGTLAGGRFSGKWQLNGQEGKFGIQMRTCDTKLLVGHCEEGGRQFGLKLLLSFGPSAVFGFGNDSLGRFVVEGKLAENTIRLVKEYREGPSINYQGNVTVSDEKKFEIHGEWFIPEWKQGRLVLRETERTQDCTEATSSDELMALHFSGIEKRDEERFEGSYDQNAFLAPACGQPSDGHSTGNPSFKFQVAGNEPALKTGTHHINVSISETFAGKQTNDGFTSVPDNLLHDLE